MILNLLLEIVQSLICTDFSPTPSSGHTVLPRGDRYHKFSRCSINHFNARLASFGLSGLIRYMQSSDKGWNTVVTRYSYPKSRTTVLSHSEELSCGQVLWNESSGDC